MKFFDSFWKSSFYKEGHAVSFWRAFGKVVLITFIASIGYAVLSYATFGKNIPTYVETYSREAIDGYPPTLVLTIKDGKLSKNIPGKLQLYPVSSDTVGQARQGAFSPHYIVTIDDEITASLDAFNESDSYILLAKDGLITKSNTDVRMKSYADMSQSTKDFVFSQADLVAVTDWVGKYKDSAPYILVAIIIAGCSILSPLGWLFSALFYGLILMWLSKWVIGKKVGFGESYILSFYALAPIILVSAVLHVIPFLKTIVNGIPFFTTLLILAFLWYMFKGKESHVTPIVA
jgi:hypothetical protein